jgi:uncharacterized protein YggU (UPF0235/DUF167 family)
VSDAVEVTLRVTPRAGRDEVIGPDAAGVLRIRVAAAPIDGGANLAVLRTLARSLDVPASWLELVGGASSRTKRLRVHHVDAAYLLERWPGLTLRPV